MARRGFIIGSTTEVGAPSFTAKELSAFEAFFLTGGVIQQGGTELKVVENGTPNMTVTVKAGEALIPITTSHLASNETYNLYAVIDADEVLNVTAADATHPRIDRVVIRGDVDENPNAAASNPPIVLEVIAGVAAASPVAPALPANARTLATISVPAGDTTIGTAQITDARTYAELNADVLMAIARLADLASTASGKGASLIGIEDAGGDFTATTVEAALAELRSLIADTASCPVVKYLTISSSNLAGSSSTSEVDVNQSYSIPTVELNVQGAQYVMEMEGLVRNDSAGAATYRLYLGAALLGTVTLPNMGADKECRIVAKFTVRTTGASGTVVPSFYLHAGETTADLAHRLDANNAAVTVDLTADRAFKLSAQYPTSNAGSGLQSHQMTVIRRKVG